MERDELIAVMERFEEEHVRKPKELFKLGFYYQDCSMNEQFQIYLSGYTSCKKARGEE